MNKNQVYYPLDNLSYKLVLLFLIINTFLSILTINYMTPNIRIGVEIMITIIISLLSFLIAIRLQNYTPTWEFRTFILGIVQLLRIIVLPSLHSNGLQLMVQVMLLLSGLLLIGVSLMSRKNQRKRDAYIEEKVRSYGGGK